MRENHMTVFGDANTSPHIYLFRINLKMYKVWKELMEGVSREVGTTGHTVGISWSSHLAVPSTPKVMPKVGTTGETGLATDIDL